ncbi:hypothetical protein PG306_02455 [Riemerella anatipestifer]|nr:hypothetical protein [Riemerella anatipestifer]MDY3396555.1 hypothetical protein [Riemerella anatipestifer]MDY3409320.1 hypothetical protein [Riemerella anatipestifer]MDY3421826.1 hypothetical protein [Riemerella anatipestifer]MDY3424099.1 hypothetical protein [Riemerella anatipestifer]
MIRLESYFEVDKENYLGFYGYDIFKFETLEITFDNILTTNLLLDTKDNESFGPFKTNQLTENDFDKIDFTILNRVLSEFCLDKNWGADLEVFRHNTFKVFNRLKIENDEIYYINLEGVRAELIPENNFWTYFVGLICINKDEQKIIKIYFGGD